MRTVDLRIAMLSAAARRSAELARLDREARDAAIAEADVAGRGVRDIWAATGETEQDRLSVSHVDRIINREAAKRQAAFEERVMQ